jgi:Flp pilus assembly protein TadG
LKLGFATTCRARFVAADRRGVPAVEMALVMPALIAFLPMLFEVAYRHLHKKCT